MPPLLAASVLCIFAGLYHYSSGFPAYWKTRVFLDFLAWIVASSGVAWLLRQNARTQAPYLFACAVSIYLFIGVGLPASLAVALLFASAFLYGRALLRLVFREESGVPSWSQCLFAGLLLLLAVFGVLIHFPVNYRALYLAILSAPVLSLLISGKLLDNWRGFAKGVATRTKELDNIPYRYFVLAVILLGAVARYAFFPTVGYDENAQHLRLWTELAYRHIYSFDVLTQVWEVAPFAVELLHAIASLTAGADVRGALNLAFLLLLFTQIWAILAAFSLRQYDRLLILLLFASTPMLGNLIGTLQTELFLALMVASGTRFALEAKDGWLSSRILAVIAIAAMCSATKLPGALIGVLLMAAAAAQVWLSRDAREPRQRIRSRAALLLFVSLAVLVALNSYLTAWKITGNPFFPLYNGIFKSPYFEAKNFSDTRWIKGFSLKTYWEVFFRTSGFLESKDFVAGFQYLFLPFIALLVLARTHRAKMMIVLIPLIGFGAVMFSMTQYWRYVFPALPLATVLIGTLLWQEPANRGPALHLVIAQRVILICIAINLFFLPGISWVFESAPQQAYTEQGRLAITDKISPTKLITAYLNERHDGARVLFPASAPFGAGLRGSPIYVNWYAPARETRFGAIKSLEAAASFLKDEQVGFVVWSTSDRYTPENPEWFLREYLSRAGYPELQASGYILYRVVGHDLDYREIFNLRKQVSDNAVMVGNDPPGTLATVPTNGATIIRYHASLVCRSPAGRFVAQINWNNGTSYYRLIPCGEMPSDFSESLPVPSGASRAEIRIARQDTPEISLTNFTLETN
ncbi:hypothetical protein P3W85_34775 [Cupriavidus basilensis]|uniref:Glycosyltransferase RgtA/B/C/D-like domain-containing protein n=1 Tax=Cupriavidus basilensis TaxID=68895 RepID=A0ABT6B2A6_9BURK|nr:hypothetical protein [Cupriavidus basilensis]MDF3838061.1 hypothetical protein [Cupriavidus basilensis]